MYICSGLTCLFSFGIISSSALTENTVISDDVRYTNKFYYEKDIMEYKLQDKKTETTHMKTIITSMPRIKKDLEKVFLSQSSGQLSEWIHFQRKQLYYFPFMLSFSTGIYP